MIKKEILNTLFKKNGLEYNYAKAAEELSELSLVLQQKLLKPTKVNDKDIIDEIGDVKLRLKILEKYFPKQSIKDRIKYKLGKYKEYLINNTYSKI